MQQACWKAATDNRYWIDVLLGQQPLSVMVDVGLVDAQGRVGFEVDPAVYDHLKGTGHLSAFRQRTRRDASGRLATSETGRTAAQLRSPRTALPIGPQVQVYLSRGDAGVPSRVGVVFFHVLRGCRVIWDLDQRLWCIEWP
jgi:hypothetical protein